MSEHKHIDWCEGWEGSYMGPDCTCPCPCDWLVPGECPVHMGAADTARVYLYSSRDFSREDR